MKKWPYFLALFIISMLITSCIIEDEKDKNDNLDPALIGYWVYKENDEIKSAWRFSSDGTAVQSLYGIDYDWKWLVESGQIKLYVDFGIPRYVTYKIVHDKLYFWVDEINDWGLPFIKQ